MKKNYRSIKAIGTGLLLIFTALNGCKTDLSPEPQEAKQTSSSNATNYIHPGILNTAESLNDMVYQYNTSSDPDYGFRRAAFSRVTGWINNTTNHSPSSFVTGTAPIIIYVAASAATPEEKMVKNDAILAYANALAWATTAETKYLTAAKAILNAYGSRFNRFEAKDGVTSQAYLEAAWVAPTFVAAAEIIKTYNRGGAPAPWTNATEVSNFRNFAIKLHNDYVANIPLTKKGNWGVSAGYAKMALGVYLDQYTSVYLDGRNRLLNAMPDEIAASGEVGDFCVHNDCEHGQYSLTALTYGAEIARNQGETGVNSIYDANYGSTTRRLLMGYYWTDKLFTSGTVSNCVSCTSYSDIYPGVEVAADYYKHSSIYNLSSQNADSNPYNNIPLNDIPNSFTFLGFTSFTHRNVGERSTIN